MANNLIIECIARNTPIVVNRMPGTKFYLGPDYPLFYEQLPIDPEIFSDNSIFWAHDYLKRLDKSWLEGGAFVNSVKEAVKTELFTVSKPPSGGQ